MSCAQVMYQPYAPYLPYDRSASSSEVSDKRYRLHDATNADGSSYASSYLLLGRPSYSTAGSNASSSTAMDGSGPSTPADALAQTATNVSIGSPSPIAGPAVSSPSVIVPQPKSGMSGSVISIHVKDLGNDSESDEAHREAQYLSANCVVFVNYSGDASSIVDEHFHRALSQKYSSEGTNSLSQRSFPPSFWNSNYQPPKASASYGSSSAHASQAHASHHDIFSHAEAYHAHAVASLHNHHAHHAAAHHAHLAAHQADPWHYSLSSQAYSHNLAGSYAGVSGSRFTPQYGSFLLQPGHHPGRLPTVTGVPSGSTAHCSVKSEPWTGRYPEPLPFPSSDLAHPIDATSYSAAAAATGHSYSNMTGLETSQVQEPAAAAAKDLYWF